MNTLKFSESLGSESSATNYHNWIFGLISKYTKGRILDVGAGLGTMAKKFQDQGHEVFISEIDAELLEVLRKKFKKVYSYDIFSKEFKRIKSKKIDTIISVNVLEHLQHDEKALEILNSILEPHGRLILFLPALPIIYGSFDVVSGHYRRYRRAELISKLKNANFKVKEIRFVNFVGTFAWFFTNRILKLTKYSTSTVGLYDKFIPLFASIEKYISIPFGQSLLVYAVKK